MSVSSQICEKLYALARDRNGANVEIALNGVSVLLVQRIEDADHILRLNAPNYLKNMAWFRQVLGASRFSEEGDAWTTRRDLTQQYFVRFDRERTFQLASREARTACAALLANSAAGQTRADDGIFRRMTAAVFVENFFSVPLDELDIDLGTLATLMEYGSEYSFVPAGRTGEMYRERLALLPALRRRVLADLNGFRNGQVPVNPMLAGLLAADSDPETDFVLEHELFTLFAAGGEASAATMGWACYLLAKYPEMQERLRDLATAFWLGPSQDWATLSRIAPLASFMSETLRLYPSTPIVARLPRAADRIGAHEIAAGQNVLISFVGIQHDRRWRVDPWMPDLGENAAQPAGGSATAFGFGPRVCGGKHFALVELVSFLSVLLLKARFELTSEAPPVFHWKTQMIREGGQPVRLIPTGAGM